jgi:hypothetical protein
VHSSSAPVAPAAIGTSLGRVGERYTGEDLARLAPTAVDDAGPKRRAAPASRKRGIDLDTSGGPAAAAGLAPDGGAPPAKRSNVELVIEMAEAEKRRKREAAALADAEDARNAELARAADLATAARERSAQRLSGGE